MRNNSIYRISFYPPYVPVPDKHTNRPYRYIQPTAFKRMCLFQGVTKLRQNVTGIPKLSEEREVITDKKWW